MPKGKGSRKSEKDEKDKEVKDKKEKKEKKEQPKLESYSLASPGTTKPKLESYSLASPGTTRPRTVPRRQLKNKKLPKAQLKNLEKVAAKTPKDLIDSDSDSESEDPNILYRGFTTKKEALGTDIESKYVMEGGTGSGIESTIGKAWNSHVGKTKPDTPFISTTRSIKPAAYFGTLGAEGDRIIGKKKSKAKKKAETPVYAPKPGRIIKIDKTKLKEGSKGGIHTIMDSTNPEHYNAFLRHNEFAGRNARKGQELSLYAPKGYKIPKDAILGYYDVTPLEYFDQEGKGLAEENKQGHEKMIARYREIRDKNDENLFVKKFYYSPTEDIEKTRPPRKYEFQYHPLDENPHNVGRKIKGKERKRALEHTGAGSGPGPGAGSGSGFSGYHSASSSSDRPISPSRRASPARSSSRPNSPLPYASGFPSSYPPVLPILDEDSFRMPEFMPELPPTKIPEGRSLWNPNFSPLSSNPYPLPPTLPPPLPPEYSYETYSPSYTQPLPKYAKGGRVQMEKQIRKTVAPTRNQAPKKAQRRGEPKQRKMSTEESFRRMMMKGLI